MAKCLELRPVLEKWCNNIKEAAVNMRMEEGLELPGYELRSGRSASKSEDAKIAYQIAQEEGLTPEEFADCCAVAPAQLAELIASKAKHGAKGSTNKRIRQALVDKGAVTEGQEYFYLARTKQTKELDTWTV